MRVLNDFVCKKGHKQERFVGNELTEVECKTCGLIATKVRAVPHFMLEGTSGSFPSAAAKWTKDREKRLKKEQRTIAEHGE
jgi:hypothetical protein